MTNAGLAGLVWGVFSSNYDRRVRKSLGFSYVATNTLKTGVTWGTFLLPILLIFRTYVLVHSQKSMICSSQLKYRQLFKTSGFSNFFFSGLKC